MILRSHVNQGKEYTRRVLAQAHVLVSEDELERMEVGDFGLSNWREEGAQIVTFVNTERVGFKVICLMPDQALPEHWHTAVEGDALGKEEILRVVHGTLRLYLPGDQNIREGKIPAGKEACYTCREEHIMHPGEQMLLTPGVKHWLQGGQDGAVVYSISSAAHCQLDPFTDPGVVRVAKVIEDGEQSS